MKSPRKHASATAFRVALEDRLKKLAQEEGLDLQRVRRQAAFDRLLCRLFAEPDAPWLLNGHSRNLSTSQDARGSVRTHPATGLMVRAVLRDGGGMWPRTGHGETFRRGGAVLPQAQFMTPTGELDHERQRRRRRFGVSTALN